MYLLITYDPKEAESLLPRLEAELKRLPRLNYLMLPKVLERKTVLRQADLVLAILSPLITDGHPAWDDVLDAQGFDKEVLPILLGDAALPVALEGHYSLDLSQNPDAGLRKLIAHLKNRLGIPDGATSPLDSLHIAPRLQSIQDYLRQTDPNLAALPHPQAGMSPWVMGLGLMAGVVVIMGLWMMLH